MRDFYVSGLEVVPITSAHIPLARTQSYRHTLEQIGLGNVPSSTQEETGISSSLFFVLLCFYSSLLLFYVQWFES